MTTVIPSNYSDVLSDFVRDQSQQTTLWNQFVATLGLPVGYMQAQLAAALSGTTRLNSFVSYLQGMTALIPANYLAMLKSFVQDPIGQADAWGNFVATLNIPPGQTLAQVLADSATTAKFIGFLGDRFVASASQILYSLSPDAVVQRAVLFNTFNLVITMLQTLQNTVAGEANSLTFFGKWQQEYTNLIAKVPIYTSQAQAAVPSTVAAQLGSVNFGTRPGAVYVPNNWTAADIASGDLTKLGLVYNGFDLNDVVQSLATQAALAATQGGANAPADFSVSSPPQDFAFPSDDFGTPGSTNHLEITMQITFHVTNPATGAGIVGLGFNVLALGNGSQVGDQNAALPFIAIAAPTTTEGSPLYTFPGNLSNTYNYGWSGSTDPTQLATNIKNSLVGVLNSTTLGSTGSMNFQIVRANYNNYTINVGNNPNGTIVNWNVANGNAPQIAWQSNTVSPTDTAQTTYTAQKNAKLQQYIQTLQSYKQLVANQAQAQQAALDSTKESITQQVDLLNSIIQALQTIVASIFK